MGLIRVYMKDETIVGWLILWVPRDFGKLDINGFETKHLRLQCYLIRVQSSAYLAITNNAAFLLSPYCT